ncbi:class I SAM-dependent methyltransferase [Caenimonas terrae]|uniref:Class I SAM-dependent methyltransferase n=1 Tax=Caenimonas terrae TaxID=696074 RepID=A0ABW0NGW0_9BURK
MTDPWAPPEHRPGRDELLDHAVARLQATRDRPAAPCKICGQPAEPFDMVDFHKSCDRTLYPLGLAAIPVIYRRCSACAFIFTDFFDQFTAGQWRAHVYNADYAKVDPEYLGVRPRGNARDIVSFLAGRRRETIGLDYGGGEGMTAALLRENGWAFDSYDPYATTELTPEFAGRYNFCSAFEVFEHSPDPAGSLRQILQRASPDELTVYIGTGTHDGIVTDETRLSWWYVAPRNGHVSIYSRRSLQILAQQAGLRYVGAWPFRGTHVLTRGIGDGAVRSRLVGAKLVRQARTVLHAWPKTLP